MDTVLTANKKVAWVVIVEPYWNISEKDYETYLIDVGKLAAIVYTHNYDSWIINLYLPTAIHPPTWSFSYDIDENDDYERYVRNRQTLTEAWNTLYA